MTWDLAELAPVVVTTLGGLITVWLVSSRNKSEQREMYPKETIADLRREIEGLRNEVATLKTEVREVRQENREITDYAHRLRRQVADQVGPPPLDWPEGLTT